MGLVDCSAFGGPKSAMECEDCAVRVFVVVVFGNGYVEGSFFAANGDGVHAIFYLTWWFSTATGRIRYGAADGC